MRRRRKRNPSTTTVALIAVGVVAVGVGAFLVVQHLQKPATLAGPSAPSPQLVLAAQQAGASAGDDVANNLINGGTV